MFYPFKFKPVYKDYIWGGRNLEKLGKKLPPEGIVAESWEISSHPNGVSIIDNGEFSGMPLTELIKKFGRQVVGKELPEKALQKFPLLVKLIDANDKLSVQVHPSDEYAFTHENGELGKNEMWYIIAAKPGAKLIYDLKPGITKEKFVQAVGEDRIEECLKSIPVFPGDTLNIPAGLIHAIGAGIVLAEIQQNSDTTYRIYDYQRKNGIQRPLHIEKALEVIDFNKAGRKEKTTGLSIKINEDASKKFLVANQYFAVELFTGKGSVKQIADGSKFQVYLLTEGTGEIRYSDGTVPVNCGESVLIPATLGEYILKGEFQALKAFVPDLESDLLSPLRKAGFSESDIYQQISGLKNY